MKRYRLDHDKLRPHDDGEWYAVTDVETEIERLRGNVSKVPCCRCGGEVIEFTINNDTWNFLVRDNGPEYDREYLCVQCFATIAAEKAKRLRAQRDQAWRTLSRVEYCLGRCDEAGLAIILADGHSSDSAAEWNTVLEAERAAGEDE